jgi:hypothetical protein
MGRISWKENFKGNKFYILELIHWHNGEGQPNTIMGASSTGQVLEENAVSRLSGKHWYIWRLVLYLIDKLGKRSEESLHWQMSLIFYSFLEKLLKDFE